MEINYIIPFAVTGDVNKYHPYHYCTFELSSSDDTVDEFLKALREDNTCGIVIEQGNKLISIKGMNYVGLWYDGEERQAKATCEGYVLVERI